MNTEYLSFISVFFSFIHLCLSFLFLIALLCREVTAFYMLILYTATSLNFQISSNSFLVESLEFSIHNIWRRKQQSTPVFLPGEYHGQRNMVDYNPWVCTELDTTEATKQHTNIIPSKIETVLIFPFQFGCHLFLLHNCSGCSFQYQVE